MKIDFGVGLATNPPNEFIETVKGIEELGFDYLWVEDEQFHRDCYVHLALAALNTVNIKLGTAVTNTVTRHPAITAEAIGTIDELSNGRVVLGMGRGGTIRKMLKLKSPTNATKEAVLIIKQLLQGEKVNFEGSYFNVKGGKSAFKTRCNIPVYLAGSGPRMLKMAGMIADGAIIHVGTNPKTIGYALKSIQDGLKVTNRPKKQFYTVCWTAAVISENTKQDREQVKPFVAWLLANCPKLGSIAGIDEKEIQNVTQHYWKKRLGTNGKRWIGKVVTEEMVNKFALVGSPEACIKKCRSIATEGVNQIAIEVVGDKRRKTIKAFKEKILDAI